MLQSNISKTLRECLNLHQLNWCTRVRSLSAVGCLPWTVTEDLTHTGPDTFLRNAVLIINNRGNPYLLRFNSGAQAVPSQTSPSITLFLSGSHSWLLLSASVLSFYYDSPATTLFPLLLYRGLDRETDGGY